MSSRYFLRGRPNQTDADRPRGEQEVKVKGALKRPFTNASKPVVTKKGEAKVLRSNHDEEIPSDLEGSDNEIQKKEASSDEEETIQEKRLRLAKHYLKEIEKQEREADEFKQIDKNVIAHRLKEDVLEKAGRLHRSVADSCKDVAINIRSLFGHKLSPTCLVISSDDKYIFSASKDGALIKWCVVSGQRLKILQLKRPKNSTLSSSSHTKPIACLAISTDNKFLVKLEFSQVFEYLCVSSDLIELENRQVVIPLIAFVLHTWEFPLSCIIAFMHASGSQDKLIHIWDPDTMNLIHTFKGHRSTVSGLAFRKGTLDLYSASEDRSVKVWNLTEMVYVETLFGHHGAISAIDALARERAITAGGCDNTVRIWKIMEESQLVFTGQKGSIDCVRLIDEEHFISCGTDGSLALWGVLKKKPLVSVSNAHGNGPNSMPNWITSVAALQNTDLIASGSCDGQINLWKCGVDYRSLTKLHSIPIEGFVNSLQFSIDGSFLVAAVGQEHRLGRWWKIKTKNSITIIPLK